MASCPNCSIPLVRVHLPEGGMVESCQRCNGGFYDSSRLAVAIELSNRGDSPLLCPRCQTPLQRGCYKDSLWLRHCSACSGFWFDAGDVDRLRRLEGIESVFAPGGSRAAGGAGGGPAAEGPDSETSSPPLPPWPAKSAMWWLTIVPGLLVGLLLGLLVDYAAWPGALVGAAAGLVLSGTAGFIGRRTGMRLRWVLGAMVLMGGIAGIPCLYLSPEGDRGAHSLLDAVSITRGFYVGVAAMAIAILLTALARLVFVSTRRALTRP